MRVLHLINSLGAGGAEVSLQEMLPGLANHGLEPHVAIFNSRAEGVAALVRDGGTPVHDLECSRWGARLRKTHRLIRDLRPAVVHTTLFDSDVVGRLAAVGTRTPVVTSLVNTSYDESREADPRVNPWKLRAAQRLDATTARRLSAGFHAITPPVKADAVRRLGVEPASIRVIPRGRSEQRLGRRSASSREQARRKLGVDDDTTLVLNIGRREYQKAQDVLIDAMPAVLESRKAVLCIAGRDGNASNDLSAQVTTRGLTDQVRFLGHRTDIPALLCAADVFVFPSRFEGLGGSLIEALALECPIVASDIPPIRYVLDEGRAGVLVPREAPRELATSILTVLDDAAGAAERTSRGRSRFESLFQLDEVTRQMAEWLGSFA